MRIKTTEIDWDTAEHEREGLTFLAQEVELEVDHEDEIADKLSDMYGWCVRGACYNIIK